MRYHDASASLVTLVGAAVLAVIPVFSIRAFTMALWSSVVLLSLVTITPRRSRTGPISRSWSCWLILSRMCLVAPVITVHDVVNIDKNEQFLVGVLVETVIIGDSVEIQVELGVGLTVEKAAALGYSWYPFWQAVHS